MMYNSLGKIRSRDSIMLNVHIILAYSINVPPHPTPRQPHDLKLCTPCRRAFKNIFLPSEYIDSLTVMTIIFHFTNSSCRANSATFNDPLIETSVLILCLKSL